MFINSVPSHVVALLCAKDYRRWCGLGSGLLYAESEYRAIDPKTAYKVMECLSRKSESKWNE